MKTATTRDKTLYLKANVDAAAEFVARSLPMFRI